MKQARRCFRTALILTLIIINVYLTLKLQQLSQPVIQHIGLPCGDTPKFLEPFPEKENQQPIPVYDRNTKSLNISLKLGHWDRQRLFKTFYFVKTGTNFTKLSEQFSVTLGTQSSLEKLHSIVQVALQWTGPISAALYASGDDEYSLLTIYLNYLQDCFPAIRERAAFHLTVPKARAPSLETPKLFAQPTFDCRKPEAVLKGLLKQRSQATSRWRLKNAYPQNHLRNTARKTCQTHYIFLTDIDIIPSSGFALKLDEFLKSARRKCIGNCAYVIPTYEVDDRAAFPKNKQDLIRLVKKDLARPFHQKVFIYNQYATNFSKWEKFGDYGDSEVVVSHNVTNFEFLYEPFYVSVDTVPEHDERFIGYGYTRNTQVYEMFVAGYQFQVLSPIFTVHWGLQVKKGRPAWRERQNSNNRKHFNIFKQEVFARYNKDPLNMMSKL